MLDNKILGLCLIAISCLVLSINISLAMITVRLSEIAKVEYYSKLLYNVDFSIYICFTISFLIGIYIFFKSQKEKR